MSVLLQYYFQMIFTRLIAQMVYKYQKQGHQMPANIRRTNVQNKGAVRAESRTEAEVATAEEEAATKGAEVATEKQQL